MSEQYFIIDFDSTFIRFEALDELAEIALKDGTKKEERLKQIKEYTRQAMEGKLSFPESLQKRIELLDANKKDIDKLVRVLKRNISTSIKRNENFFKEFSDRIFIISGGFKEYIAPVVSDYNIPENHIFANTFEFDQQGRITGFDKENYLAQENGKVKQLKNIDLEGEIFVIGDGYTDYELKEAGLADKFFSFTENIERASLLDKADHITPSFDEFLFKNKLPMSISYPKNRIRAYVMDNLPDYIFEAYRKEGYQVESFSADISSFDFKDMLKNASILAVSPQLSVTHDDLLHAKRLLVIGVYGEDRGNIDTDTCLQKGIITLHAPHTNTRSVAELAMGEIIMLLRKIPSFNHDLHQGHINPQKGSLKELKDRKLGIIGYGKIGKQLSHLAEYLGMSVYFYDNLPLEGIGNAIPCEDMEELLELSDVVSVHVTDSDENKNLIDAHAFDQMKEGAIFLNLSCQKAVDQEALKEALKSKKIMGAGIDRFPVEHDLKIKPGKFDSGLQNLENVLLTPHISGMTDESRDKTAEYVTQNIIKFINCGEIETSINFPDIELPPLENAHRLIHIHQDQPGMMATISNVLAEHDINVEAQFLKTNKGVGYLITDISRGYNERVINAIKQIPQAIRLRILY